MRKTRQIWRKSGRKKNGSTESAEPAFCKSGIQETLNLSMGADKRTKTMSRHVSHVTCHVLHITYQLTPVTYPQSLISTATDPHPGNSPTKGVLSAPILAICSLTRSIQLSWSRLSMDGTYIIWTSQLLD